MTEQRTGLAGPESDADLLRRTGRLRIAEFGIELQRAFKETDFLKAIPESRWRPSVFNGQYHSYFVEHCKILGYETTIAVYFRSGALFDVYITPQIDGDNGYHSGRQDLLQQHARRTTSLFIETTGISVPAEFDWGEIWAGDGDPRSWSASIVVAYKGRRALAAKSATG